MLKNKSNWLSALMFAFFILFAAPQMIHSQEKVVPIKQGEEITFHSKILDQEREIMVFKPVHDASFGKELPVLILLDGRNHFDYASGMVSFLSRQRKIPPMLVVAIKNIDRNKDFTPVQYPGLPSSGGAENFHKFIEKELFPLLEERYYCSHYRVLLGHSLGGMFANWSMIQHPETFDAYLSISPYLQWAEEYVVDQSRKKLPVSFEKAKNLYMTLGDEPGYTEVHERYLEILEMKKPGNLDYTYRIFEKENHASVPLPSFHNGLLTIFQDWQLNEKSIANGLAGLDKHHKYLSEKYGMEIFTSEQMINLLGYKHLQEGKLEQAIATLEENVKRFPNSANVYDSLGDAYKAAGKKDLALKNYKKAVKLGSKQKSPFIDTYKKNMESVKE